MHMTEVFMVYTGSLINKVLQNNFPFSLYHVTNGPRRDKTCLQGFGNNIGTYQLAWMHSLISAFVVRLLESIISKLATSKFSSF